MTRLAAAAPAVFVALSVAVACRAQSPAPEAEMDAMDSTDQHAAHAAHEAMSGSLSMDPHLVLTPLRPRSPADSSRAAQLVAQVRAALVRYHDVRAAEADGFRKFLPGVKQPIYHFTSRRWAVRATRRFDPTRPTSLLYREGPGGTLVLAGAMYTAPARTSLDALDQRVPLSVARWHEHVNWCLPPRGQRDRWRETRDGNPVFGPAGLFAYRARLEP